MNSGHFDELSRAASGALTRRGLWRGVAGIVAAIGAAATGTTAGEAKRSRKAKRCAPCKAKIKGRCIRNQPGVPCMLHTCVSRFSFPIWCRCKGRIGSCWMDVARIW